MAAFVPIPSRVIGPQGDIGPAGTNGLSAYEVAVSQGYVGTINEWILSLQGMSAYDIAVDEGFVGSINEWVLSLQGSGGVEAVNPTTSGTWEHSGDAQLAGTAQLYCKGLSLSNNWSSVSAANYTGTLTGYGDTARLLFRRADGTEESPVATPNNARIFIVQGRVWDSTNLFSLVTAHITAISAEAATATAHGCKMSFNVTKIGTLDHYMTFSLEDNGDVLSTGGGVLGYGVGSGGATVQPTSRTTGVAINKSNGDITLFTAAGSATPATFTVSNNLISLYDVPTIAVRGATNKYITAITNVIAGTSFDITYWTTGGTASDTPIFHFNLNKGSIV